MGRVWEEIDLGVAMGRVGSGGILGLKIEG